MISDRTFQLHVDKQLKIKGCSSKLKAWFEIAKAFETTVAEITDKCPSKCWPLLRRKLCGADPDTQL